MNSSHMIFKDHRELENLPQRKDNWRRMEELRDSFARCK
jgi:hypothetical protein